MNLREHWNQVYQTKGPSEVSWYQDSPTVSLQLIQKASIAKEAGIIDVGGGASMLAECLLLKGYRNLAVLDLSSAAIAHAKTRLGARATEVKWIEDDVTAFVPSARYGLWHDRAVFHFLTKSEDRKKYMANLSGSLVSPGNVIIATFAIDGPSKCSGLEVARYDADSISKEFGAHWVLQEEVDEMQRTPWGTEQKFSYFRLTERVESSGRGM